MLWMNVRRGLAVVVCIGMMAAFGGCDPQTSKKASLQVTLAPAGAGAVGAQWQIEYGDWQNSGTTLSDLSAGTCTIRFRDLAGWNTPAAATMTLRSGKATTYTATYTAFTGTGGLTQAELELFASQAAEYGWTFTTGFNSATDRALTAITGDIETELPSAPQKSLATAVRKDDIALPAAYDWRALNGVTPVKNVQGCAASWAFATNAVTEASIRILDEESVDLSEQYLLSANTYGWTCGIGGNRAFDFYSTSETLCESIGAVLEDVLPYQSADEDINCPYDDQSDCPYKPQYQLQTWGYVDDESPTVEEIKTAIMTYGPIYTSVTADRAFQAYTGGIYNNNVSGSTNLAVVLVGWDGAQGTNGVWILRNAWGNGWGEDDGYMRIEYECSNVGRWATYIQYTGYRAPVIEDLVINDGELITTSRSVSISPVWKGTRPSKYMASEQPDFYGASWKAFTDPITFTLSSGNASKAVYVKLKNYVGESNRGDATIILKEATGEGEGEGEGEGDDDGERDFAGITFIWCPSGSFYMGSATETANEYPRHNVSISQGFWLSKFEVTQAQYTAIMSTNPSAFTGNSARPVDSVSWDDANAYIDALNDKYPGKHFRLPTEAEWEYACRAGKTTTYTFSNSSTYLYNYAWYSTNSGNTTKETGQKTANPWGFYDMYGNVDEWVRDAYGSYTTASQTDPVGPLGGTYRVRRGGSWQSTAAECTSASRRYAGPASGAGDSTVGFRLAKD